MKTLLLILSVCFLLSCEKEGIQPTKSKGISIGGHNGNYYYGYSIFAPVDTIKVRK